MKILKWMLVGLLCVVLILGMVFGPGIYREWKMLAMIRSLWDRPEASFQIRVDDRVDFRLDWQELPQGRIFILETGGVKVCFCNGVIYLENGKGFDFSRTTEDFLTVVQSAWKMLPLVRTEYNAGVWTAVLHEPAVNLTMVEGESGFRSAQLHFADTEAEILPQLQRSPLEVPVSVRQAVALGEIQGSGDMAQALIRLLGAWAELGSRNLLAMDMNLSADCGPLSLRDTLDMRMDRNLGIGYVEKNGRGLYFKEGKICTADGKLLVQTEANVEAVQLLGMTYLLLLNGDFTCRGEIYSLELDQKGMEQFAYTIAPDAKNLSITLESGRIQLVLGENRLDTISVSCVGSLDLILTTVEISIGAELEMKEAEFFTVNQKVLDALTQ